MATLSPSTPDPFRSRATSIPTKHSSFEDSAVDFGTPTPSPKRKRTEYTTPESTLMADRFIQLASLARVAEQDDRVHSAVRRNVLATLDDIEKNLKQDVSENKPDEAGNADDPTNDSDLQDVLTHLATTVSSLKERREEQQHLHELSRSRLESIAQRCLEHEQKVKELHTELQSLRLENQLLGGVNEALCTRVNGLEQQMTQRDVTVDAMTGAVTGLESWIDNVQHSPRARGTENASSKRTRRPVVRGRGRFRGKHYIDDDDDHTRLDLDGASDVQEVQEGVKAWLRGFHDVEEGLKVVRGSKEVADDGTRPVDEDFGEFERAG